jgi:hypothetical protein
VPDLESYDPQALQELISRTETETGPQALKDGNDQLEVSME